MWDGIWLIDGDRSVIITTDSMKLFLVNCFHGADPAELLVSCVGKLTCNLARYFCKYLLALLVHISAIREHVPMNPCR